LLVYASDVRRALKEVDRDTVSARIDRRAVSLRLTAVVLLLNGRLGIVELPQRAPKSSVKHLCQVLKAEFGEDPSAACTEIARLKARFDLLAAEIEQDRRHRAELLVALQFAPIKPKVRSIAACIASIGSRRISQKLTEGFTNSAQVWTWGKEAAMETAVHRYNLTAIPHAALTSMRLRLLSCYPAHKWLPSSTR